MKRINSLYDNICKIENLKLAHNKAKRGKSKQYGVIKFNKNEDDLLINLHHILLNLEFNTSEYSTFIINDGKEREIHKLPYYPDRIVHHAILNLLEPIFIKSFTSSTYSCIKGRGIHKCLNGLTKSLKDINNTKYCLKLDIKKFYPSVNNEILKSLLDRKFKDKKLIYLLFNIIDSSKGLPIGNYLSQYLANFYLNYFDHWIKEVLKIKYYFRYCDDLVILGNNKDDLRKLLNRIRNYLFYNLDLELSNYQIFPVKSRGIDFLGYVSYHSHVRLRKRIKTRFIKMINKNNNYNSKMSYKGWLDHCNSINLKNKYLYEQ